MKAIDQLLIRACKSKDPKTRLQSVYRRFYLNADADARTIAGFLIGICNRYGVDIPLNIMFSEMFFIVANSRTETVDPWSVTRILINRIRFSDVNIFIKQGMSVPARFKEKA